MEKKKYIQPNVLVVLFEGNLMDLNGLSVYKKNPSGENIFVENGNSTGDMEEDARARQTNLWDVE